MLDKSELPMAIRGVYLALHRRTDAKFADYGVTADQFVLLATLSRGHALTQRELARRMPSDPSTVRAMLVLLEKQGLIQREVHPSDSRARTVAMTAAGRKSSSNFGGQARQFELKCLKQLNPTRQLSYYACLIKSRTP